MAEDRSIWIAADADRAAAENEKTVIVGLGTRSLGDATSPSILAPDPGASFEEVFVANYARMRTSLSRRLAPGVAVFAASAKGVHGEGWIAAVPPGMPPVPLIVGRHGRADLFVPADAALSLRHLLVLARVDSDRRVRTRLVDLRSDAGLLGEDGRRLHGAEADGPVFLTAARLRLFCIPTPLARFWPDDGREAWRELPPRTIVETAPGTPRAGEGARARARSAADDADRAERREVTVVTLFPRTVEPSYRDLLAPGERPLGWLALTSLHGAARFSVGPSAFAAGVLIGKYDRCDSGGLAVRRDSSLSRVHALLLDPGDGPRMFDTGSTNGVLVAGRPQRVVALDGAVEARLGGVTATWTPAT